jgi:hypothetical protein
MRTKAKAVAVVTGLSLSAGLWAYHALVVISTLATVAASRSGTRRAFG